MSKENVTTAARVEPMVMPSSERKWIPIINRVYEDIESGRAAAELFVEFVILASLCFGLPLTFVCLRWLFTWIANLSY